MRAKYLACAQCAIQIGLKYVLPFGIFHLQCRCAFCGSGTVEEKIHFAEFFDHSIEKRVQTGAVGHVCSLDQRALAQFADRFRRGCDKVLSTTSRYYISTGFSQTFGQCKTDAGGATDNDSGLAGKIEQRM